MLSARQRTGSPPGTRLRAGPVRNKDTLLGVARGIVRQLEHQPPDVITCAPRREGVVSVRSSDGPADRMALVPVNPAVALLQVHRIARQVRVD